MQVGMALTPNSLARRKPGVQIPSPPPHNPAGQSVAGASSAALTSFRGRAGAAKRRGAARSPPDPDWLVEFTRRLVIDRLCASGHPPEPPAADHRPRQARAPYEVPSVVAVPIIDGGPDYPRWILNETAWY